MKIFSKEQIAYVDRQTRAEEAVSEIDLMERASKALVEWFVASFQDTIRIAVYAGPGNNGGDALAVARLLAELGYSVVVFLPDFAQRRSEAALINLKKLQENGAVPVFELNFGSGNPDLSGFDLLIDGLYGSGLNRPLQGFADQVINCINLSGIRIVAIDLPSGLLCDENSFNDGAIVKASHTLTLEFPKQCLFFSENEQYTGKWEIIHFGLSEKVVKELHTNMFFSEQSEISSILRRRKKFSHKGGYGHGLLLAGSQGKFGAAQLAARGALRAGLGLLTTHLPEAGALMLQIAVPESMSSIDADKSCITELPALSKYTAIGAGPGMGTLLSAQNVVKQLIEQVSVPLVLDADALNILSLHPAWLKLLRPDTILTPHPVEFDRMSGLIVKNDEERLGIALVFAHSYGVVLVLKGAFTRIIFPDGKVYFNSTGNPGMATGGSGDVLTGILLGLLCQGYSVKEAALLGVFLHGRSADLRVQSTCMESLTASDIADYLGDAFASIK